MGDAVLPKRLSEVGCLLIPSFPLACELLGRPDLVGLPAVVAALERPMVLASSPAATAVGVHPGQGLNQAMSFCPQLTVLDSRQAHYAEVSGRLVEALERVVPGVDDEEEGIFYLDFRGLERHYNSSEELAEAIFDCLPATLSAQLGLASQKFAALVAAHNAMPLSSFQVSSRDLQDFLKRQSIDCLPATPEFLERLRLFGFSHIRQIQAIPQAKFIAEFGTEGERLWLLAAGRLAEPLRVRTNEQRIFESLELESPITTREQLAVVVQQLIGRIVSSRQFQGRAARQSKVQVITEHQSIWEKVITFKGATANPNEISRILRYSVAQIELPGPVIRVSISLDKLTTAMGLQVVLPTARQAEEERLHEGLRQLRAHYGRTHVFKPLILETWSQFLEDQCALLEHNP